jgi:hypothetical protein
MIHVPCQYSHRETRDQQEWLNTLAGVQRRLSKTWKYPEVRPGALEHSKVWVFATLEVRTGFLEG